MSATRLPIETAMLNSDEKAVEDDTEPPKRERTMMKRQQLAAAVVLSLTARYVFAMQVLSGARKHSGE